MKARLKRVMKIFAAAAGMSLLMANVAAADYVDVETQEAFENCFTFKMDEKEYQLPCLLSDFLEDGWEINVTDDSLGAGYRAMLSLRRDHCVLGIGVMNLTHKIQMLEDCQVYHIAPEAENADDEGGYEFTYVDGISFGMTFEEVMDTLGATYTADEVTLNETTIKAEMSETGGRVLHYGVKVGEEDPGFYKTGYNDINLIFEEEGLSGVWLEYWADLMETETETETEAAGE